MCKIIANIFSLAHRVRMQSLLRSTRLHGFWGGMFGCEPYVEGVSMQHPFNVYAFFNEIGKTKGGNMIGAYRNRTALVAAVN